MSHFVIGVDIAKHWIDIFNPKTRQSSRIETNPKNLKAFVRSLADDTLIIMEASGGYERPLIQALITEGVNIAETQQFKQQLLRC